MRRFSRCESIPNVAETIMQVYVIYVIILLFRQKTERVGKSIPTGHLW